MLGTLPCSNCGCKDVFIRKYFPGESFPISAATTFSVECPNCKRSSEIWTCQDSAIQYWNDMNRRKDVITENEYKINGEREITNGERKVSEVINQALLRCFSGKGKERHNIEGTVDFMEQPLMEISRRTGIGGPLYQVHKKAYEAHDMVRKGDKDRARNELLDIIIYTAATVLLLDEQKEGK